MSRKIRRPAKKNAKNMKDIIPKPIEFKPFSVLNVSKSLSYAWAGNVDSNFYCSTVLKDINQSHLMISPIKSTSRMGRMMFRKSIKIPCCYSLNNGMYVTSNIWGIISFNWWEAPSDCAKKLNTMPTI